MLTLFGSFISLFAGVALQSPAPLKVDIFRQPLQPDSSLYSSVFVDPSTTWFAGENGVFLQVKLGQDKPIISNVNSFPGKGVDVYDLKRINHQFIIATGKSGKFWIYNKQSRSWVSYQVPGYGRSCFYRSLIVSKDTFFLCGGRNQIAHSRKVIPYGFIIGTTDGGKTFHEIWHSWRFFVFDMVLSAERKALAIAYAPGISRCLEFDFSSVKTRWESHHHLMHTFVKDGDKCQVLGSHHKRGVIMPMEKSAYKTYNQPIYKPWFGIPTSDKKVLIIGAQGRMSWLDANNGAVFHLPFPQSLYTGIETSPGTFLVAGSSGGLYLVRFSAS